MPFTELDIPMGDEEFRLLRDLIHSHCGLFFDPSFKFLLEKRLLNRLRIHQLKGFRDYYRFLMYDPKRDEELAVIVDILTTNETYFFREPYQLKAFSEEILPEIKTRKVNRRSLYIWSAGCSTGEEPYTLAILILESGMFRDWDVDIFANDISQRVLQVARSGIYSPSSFRATERIYLDRYFEPCGEGRYRVRDEVKRLVRFGYLNLLERERMNLLRSMDVIFCRNVIIYFDLETRKKVIQNLYEKLDEGGYLLLGHSESLVKISTAFTLEHLKNDMVYRKPFKERLQVTSLQV
ncbi:MAG: protein-glutamate O-methyltransferase CheR [Deltaproteobacteria bacterium]|nr:protein-glutamate O-methyltransferase CheR [Deltaproteobacteria bacterium]